MHLQHAINFNCLVHHQLVPSSDRIQCVHVNADRYFKFQISHLLKTGDVAVVRGTSPRPLGQAF